MDEDMKLMRESLESANEYLEKVSTGVEMIVRNMQSGREDKAIPVCVDLIDGIKWMIDCFNLTLPYQKSVGIAIDLSGIDEVNQQVVEALENRDYVLLGDLLEYEFLPIAQNWKEQVCKILEGAGGASY